MNLHLLAAPDASGVTPESPGQAANVGVPGTAPALLPLRFDPQQQLSIAQVAELLQCSERWLYGKVRDGELTATHLGRAVRVSRSNLQRFLDSRQRWRPPGAAS